MFQSALAMLLLGMLGAAACTAQHQPAAPAVPPPAARTATLDITPGVRVVTSVPLPDGFMPYGARGPLWLLDGAEIGVIGFVDDRVVVLGMHGPGWRQARVLAAETGPDAAVEGEIRDVAVSPDGMTLATAVSVAGDRALDLIIRDLISEGPGHALTTFDGSYELASLSWLSTSALALALRAARDGAPQLGGMDRSELEIVVLTGAGSTAPLGVSCPMSSLSWSPRGTFAVGQGDSSAPPVLVDRRAPECRRLPIDGPIQVLDWAGDESSFLYLEGPPRRRVPAIMRFDLNRGTTALVALSSGAAAFSGSNNVVVLGNRNFTTRKIEQRPDWRVGAEVAVLDAARGVTEIKSLGFRTMPSLLARSTMAFSRESERAAIATFGVDPDGPPRRVVVYSVPTNQAFLVAYGAASGPLSMSWSPRGSWLALVDATPQGSVLTILEPPR